MDTAAPDGETEQGAPQSGDEDYVAPIVEATAEQKELCLELARSSPSVVRILDHATKKEVRASDVHFVEGKRPWLRQGGEFKENQSLPPTSVEDIESLHKWVGSERECVTRTFFLPPETWQQKETYYDDEGQLQERLVPETSGRVRQPERWRIQTWEAKSGLKATCRLLATTPPPFKDLGENANPIIKEISSAGSGLIVFAGATGSGKTTTLAACLSLLNTQRQCHIITIENPVEYLYPNGVALIEQQEVGVNVGTAQEAFVDALRSDPDVIVLGELRTSAEAELCLEAAASGHLVFTTMHAQHGGLVCERLLADQGENGRSKLAQAFRLIVTQRLIADKKNRHARHLFVEIVRREGGIIKEIRPDGDLSKLTTQIINSNKNKGLDKSLAQAVLDGLITEEDARRNAIEADSFNNNLETLTKMRDQQDTQAISFKK